MRAQTKGASPKKRTEFQSDVPREPKETMNFAAQRLLFEGDYIINQTRGLGTNRPDNGGLKIVRQEWEDDSIM